MKLYFGPRPECMEYEVYEILDPFLWKVEFLIFTYLLQNINCFLEKQFKQHGYIAVFKV